MSRKQKRIQQKPWLTKGLLVSIKNKQKLYQSYFLNGNAYEKSFYKLYANKLTRVKNLSKKMYYKAAISERKNNIRELWKLIHSVISNKPSSPKPSISKINVDDLVIDDPLKISNRFNDFLRRLVTQLLVQLITLMMLNLLPILRTLYLKPLCLLLPYLREFSI